MTMAATLVGQKKEHLGQKQALSSEGRRPILLATLPARTGLPEGLVAGLQRLLAMGKLGWAVEAALDGWILTRLTRGPIMRGDGRPVAVFFWRQ